MSEGTNTSTDECTLIGDVIHCRCGKPSSHYGTMGERGAREVREVPPPTPVSEASKQPETPPTDEELAARLRGQLDAVVIMLTELGKRQYDIEVRLVANDSGTWRHFLSLSKTVYL